MLPTKKNASKLFKELVEDFVVFHSIHAYTPIFKRLEGNECKSYSTPDNARCHWVAYTDKRNDPSIQIVPCVSYDQSDKQYVVHFINYNPKKKEYYDNSYGSKCTQKIYYLMNNDWIERKFKKNDGVLNMDEILQITKQDLFDIIVPKGHWIRRHLNYGEAI